MQEKNPERSLGLGLVEKVKIAGGVAMFGAGVFMDILTYSEHNPYVENANSIVMATGAILAIRQIRAKPPVVEAS